MKKLLIAVFAVAALASCKKESQNLTADPQNPVFTKRLKSSTRIYDNSTPETESFIYDAQGRMSIYESGERVTTIDYNNPAKVIATVKTNNVITYIIECVVNSKGLVNKALYKNADGSVLYTYNYLYNEQDYMVMEEFVPASGTASKVEFDFVNGNPTNKKYFSDGIQTGTASLTYDVSKYYTGESPVAGVFPSPLFGKKPKNVVASTQSFDNNNSLYFHLEYSNIVNAEGYLTVRNSLNKLDGKTTTTTYEYY